MKKNFKVVEFDQFRNESGRHSITISSQYSKNFVTFNVYMV